MTAPARIAWLDADDLAARTRAWEAAARRAASPFAGPELFEAWWPAFGAGRPLATCALLDGEEVAALWPLVDDGGPLRALANEHTPLVAPFARDAHALHRLVDAVVATGRELDLADIELTPALHDALVDTCRRHRARMVLRTAMTAPYVDTSSGDLAAWRATTHPTWLARLARYGRQMERRHGLRIDLGLDGAAPESLLTGGFAIEAGGWKGRAGTAIAQDDAAEGFYRAAAAAWSQTGELRLSGLWLGDALAAFDLGVERGGRWYSLKTGYAEEHRRLVPGLVLRLAIIEHCFTTGLQAHDLLGDHADWKDKLASGTRDLRRVRVYPRRPAPMARWAWRAHVRPVARDTRAAVRERLAAARRG